MTDKRFRGRIINPTLTPEDLREENLPGASLTLVEHLEERFARQTPTPAATQDELVRFAADGAKQAGREEVINYINSLAHRGLGSN